MKPLRIALFAASLLFAPMSHADEPVAVSLPTPDGIYADPDPAAMAIHARPGGNAAFRRNLDRVLRANPRDIAALSHRAYYHYAGGFTDEGARDYARALALTAPGTEAHRHVLWSWGWSLMEAGDAAQALAKWEAAGAQASGRPFWLPYTVALAHWKLGHRDAALAWYEAAARSHSDFNSPEGVAQRTAHWRESERAIVLEVFTAWRAMHAAPAE